MLSVCLALMLPALAFAQAPPPARARRHFVSVSLDFPFTVPLHFEEHPLQDLVGSPVASAQFQGYDYETRDGLTQITVDEYKRSNRGAGITLYPLGMSDGTTLMIRGSTETLPTTRVRFDGPGSLDSYALTNARAYDAGLGLVAADRSPGWGVGSQAFVLGGAGTIRSDLGDGTRLFAEAGGGIMSGPLGVEISIKFAWNTLDEPVTHRFLTIPITLRGTVSF